MHWAIERGLHLVKLKAMQMATLTLMGFETDLQKD